MEHENKVLDPLGTYNIALKKNRRKWNCSNETKKNSCKNIISKR